MLNKEKPRNLMLPNILNNDDITLKSVVTYLILVYLYFCSMGKMLSKIETCIYYLCSVFSSVFSDVLEAFCTFKLSFMWADME